MNYQKRICCFIDILGFEQHINSTIDFDGNDVTEKIKLIESILRLAQTMMEGNDVSQTKIVTYFSDSIVISNKYDEEGQLFWNLLDLHHLSIELANLGFLIRGGVAVGKLIHNEDVIFGPALVEAYNIESKISKFPRIIVDRNTIEEGIKYHGRINTREDEREHIMNIVTKDKDDHYYIDYIEKCDNELDDEYNLALYIDNLKKHFFSNFDNEKEDVKEKLSWLKEKINNLIFNIRLSCGEPEISSELKELYSEIDFLK